jgi:Ca2+-binding EF-hand superfamily protein
MQAKAKVTPGPAEAEALEKKRLEEEAKRKWLQGGAAKVVSQGIEAQKTKPDEPKQPAPAPEAAAVNSWWANAHNVVAAAKQEVQAKAVAVPESTVSAPSLRPVLRDLFNTMDSECLGVLSYDEILLFCRVFGLPADTLAGRSADDKSPLKQAEFIDCFEKKLAKKPDAEFASAAKMISSIFKSSSSWRMDLSIIFGYVDADHNGFLTAEELFQIGQKFNPHFTIEKTQSMLARMDVNSDGKVSLDEFMAFMGDFLFSLPKKKAEKALAALKKAGAAGNVMAAQPDDVNRDSN